MTSAFVISTSAGSAEVLHRLALGVEPRDGLTTQPLATAVRVGQELPPRLLGRAQRRGRLGAARSESHWPCLDFETNGTARFKLRHAIGGVNRIKVNADGSPPTITVRIDDVRRRVVPRRFRVPVWTRLELERADPTPDGPAPGPYVLMRSRLLRPYLLPANAYPFPRGTTLIRGSVVVNGRPVRWPRVIANGPGNMRVGVAHGDEHGEFVLAITGVGITPPPVPSTIDVVLDVYAVPPNQAPAPDPVDRLADLVVEELNRPLPTDPDDVLSGITPPPGYVKSAQPTPITVGIGKSLVHPAIDFEP